MRGSFKLGAQQIPALILGVLLSGCITPHEDGPPTPVTATNTGSPGDRPIVYIVPSADFVTDDKKDLDANRTMEALRVRGFRILEGEATRVTAQSCEGERNCTDIGVYAGENGTGLKVTLGFSTQYTSHANYSDAEADARSACDEFRPRAEALLRDLASALGWAADPPISCATVARAVP